MDRAGQIVGQGQPAVTQAQAWLRDGKILAVKGSSGFHLACDARNDEAIMELRCRKRRPAKPLAVMARDLEVANEICRVTAAEARLLLSPEAPIVLLRMRTGAGLSPALAPGLNTVGVMLPYTKLQRQLLASGVDVMGCTSGNRSGLPAVNSDRQALMELGQIADYFLLYDGSIEQLCDDSVTFVAAGQSQVIRRSRGYYTAAITIPVRADKPTLAVGGDLKNAFCLVLNNQAYLSRHMGDVVTVESKRNLIENIVTFCRELGVTPALVTADLHPGYYSGRIASQLAERFGAVRHPGVQHHHAHLAACLGENGLVEGAIGILLDGTGYGTDGQLWGFEVVVGNYANYRRHYQLAAVPLPGGEYAIRNPFVTAVAYLSFFLGRRGEQIALELFPQYPSEVALTKQLMAAGVNCPLSSSCGRLFDAVAAILGVCHHNTYEGQAPSELSSLVPWVQSFDSFIPMENVTSYPYIIDGAEINPAPLLEAIIADLLAGTEIANIAWRFHETIVSMVREAAALVRAATGLNCVVLSGGSWQNRYLLERTIELLTEDGFQVYSHYLVPANDGGLALGQALVALK